VKSMFTDFRVLLPALVTALYFGTAVSHLLHRRYDWALVWFSYATANVGMIIVTIRSM